MAVLERGLLEKSICAYGVSGCGVDVDLAEELAWALGDAEEQDDERRENGHVDAILNVGEDGDKDTGKEDDDLERGALPEFEDFLWRGDQIADGMDDHGREGRVGDEEEDRGQGVESQQDDDGCEDTGERCPHASLGLDGCAGEAAGGRVSAEEGTEEVGEAESDQFLGWVDDVVVDATEGLGDGNVFDNQDQDCHGDLWGNGGKHLGGNVRGTGVLESCSSE